MGHPEDGLVRFVRQVPLIGDWLFMTLAAHRLRQGVFAANSPLRDVQLAEFRRRGYMPSILSAQRGIMMHRQEADHRTLGRADVPVRLESHRDRKVPPLQTTFGR